MVWHRLCRTVFHMPVWMAKQVVPAEEFNDWCAYYRLEPFGDDWLQTASIMSLIANIVRRKGKRAFKPDEFIPFQYEQDGSTYQRRRRLVDEYNKFKAEETRRKARAATRKKHTSSPEKSPVPVKMRCVPFA